MDVNMVVKRDEVFEMNGVTWTIQEVYRTNEGRLHSFNALGYNGNYYEIRTFECIENERREQSAEQKQAA